MTKRFLGFPPLPSSQAKEAGGPLAAKVESAEITFFSLGTRRLGQECSGEPGLWEC